jgi:hypothetical protein
MQAHFEYNDLAKFHIGFGNLFKARVWRQYASFHQAKLLENFEDKERVQDTCCPVP